MTTIFDISSRNLSRTFKEKLADIRQTSILGGLLNLIIAIVVFIPAFIFGLLWSFGLYIIGKKEEKNVFPIPKGIDTPEIHVKTFDIYERDEYYEYLKTKYNKTDDDLRDMDEVCFIETIPEVKEFEKKLFTYHMTDFSKGLILQEVDFDTWKSKLLFFDPINNKTETLRELKFTYDLSFEKINESELNIYMRFPGEKQVVTIKRN